MSYILYINQNQRVTELPLPNINDRNIQLDLSFFQSGCAVDLEIYDGVWKMLSSENISLKIDGESISEAELSDGMVINAAFKNDFVFAVMVRSVNAEEIRLKEYLVSDKLSIGRAEDNDIVIADDFVGSHHCVISDGVLTDSSKNGTFINGERVNGSQKLNIFDTIYITGHKLIYLGKMIALYGNDIAKTKLPEADIERITNNTVYEEAPLFQRAPRRIEPLDTETVEIEDPPQKQTGRSQPLIFIIGPSVTMPIPILVSVVINIVSNSNAANSGFMYLGTALSVVLSALIGTGWALAHQMYNKKQIETDEKNRKSAYNNYIENNRQLLEQKQRKNKDILENNYLPTTKLIEAAADSPEMIWNRNIYQNDFLTIRLGSGKIKLPADISVSKQRFSMNDDELCQYPHKLRDEYEMIDDCVSLIHLLDCKIIGIVGSADKTPLIANNMICQIAALHCYTDVKISLLGDSQSSDIFSWAKWLPHSFVSDHESRMIGFDENSRESVIYRMAAELRKRAEEQDNKAADKLFVPHIILFCTSADIIRNSILEKYMLSPQYLGVTFVILCDNINHLPNECKAIIECSHDFSGYYMLDGEIREENKVDFEFVEPQNAEKLARTLCGYNVGSTSIGAIPSSVDYFEMIGIGKLEQWDLIKRYKRNRSYEGLKSFIGIGQGNRPVYLDIHEKKDGPHGLVAGTTGSGKSETIQTFILSLAMNYSADDVAFVLIDYKGGGMANLFEKLPHVAGLITNLSDEGEEVSGSLTRRACSSLRSEIKRRQAIFKKYNNVNNIDSYARLYREGKANEPMPHLIIISDEFAELKREQPEFIKELVSVARVGRSLGIHLILATQKPAGVVDDEIWSNSRFRICLRVQDKQDSMGMIKRADAAYITETGRAFMQVGNDELFEEFQSGYSGGEYIPKDKTISAEDSEAVMIGSNGQPLVLHSKRKHSTNYITELSAAVDYISDSSKKAGFNAASSLWLPPLGNSIYLDDIRFAPDNDGIKAVYGIADDFNNQKQFPCIIDISECSNLKIAGGTGCGKTTLLQTILCSLVRSYSPEKINFYVLDFSSRTFKMFKRLPHCGGVFYEEERESVERVLQTMDSMIAERKKLFEKEDIGSYKEYTKLHSLPLIILAIDNFNGFMEQYGNYEEAMLKLMRECVRYGIQIVVTINNISELKYKMRSHIASSIVLRMNEKSEYTELIGKSPEIIPLSIKGRGLAVLNGTAIEYQAALPAKGRNEAERSEAMKKKFDEISGKYAKNIRANKINSISDVQPYSELLTGQSHDELVIGYDYKTIEPYRIPLSDFLCFCVSDNDYNGINRFLNNVSEFAESNSIEVINVKLNDRIRYTAAKGSLNISSIDGIKELDRKLLKEFTERNAAVAEWNIDHNGMTKDKFIAERYGRIFVLIDDMYEFCQIVGVDPKAATDFIDYFKLGKGHGIHFFGGYCSKTKTYHNVSKQFAAENYGIHIGGNSNQQNVLELDIPLPLQLKKLESNIGYCAENKTVTTIFVPERE